MLEIREYGLPGRSFRQKPEYRKFRSGLESILERLNLENREEVPMHFIVLYGKKPRVNQLYVSGYNRNKFTLEEDIQISIFRRELDNFLVREYPQASFGGQTFILELRFGQNPYAGQPEIAGGGQSRKGEALQATPVAPRYRFSQMILSQDQEHALQELAALVRLRGKIYEDWGFAEIDPMPRAVINFSGPAGTGKTMAAHALANEFGVPILALNYADIESKYVGDAPKNLVAAFELAAEHGALLFFDEADSFLGRRISAVTQSADQAINSLRSQLLMLLEDFEGIVIFATNLPGNYDPAFLSRILRHIRFELPDEQGRLRLIRKLIPQKAPRLENEFGEKDLEALARISVGFSGRDIKKAILNGLTASAMHHEHFRFEDARRAFEEVAAGLSPFTNAQPGYSMTP